VRIASVWVFTPSDNTIPKAESPSANWSLNFNTLQIVEGEGNRNYSPKQNLFKGACTSTQGTNPLLAQSAPYS
jgi:hypothetical protein